MHFLNNSFEDPFNLLIKGFECVLASPQEGPSVRPSVGLSCARLHSPSGRAEKDGQVLLVADFAVGNDEDTDANDDEKVEGRRTDDRAGTQISRDELGTANLNYGQQDFRGCVERRGWKGVKAKDG